MTIRADDSVAVEIGAQAEELAAGYLARHGYTILTRNFRCEGGELDIVAWDGATLCFVEVRARRDEDHGHPLETIGPQKIRRLIRAAGAYLDEWRGACPVTRFDALGIVLSQAPSFTLVKEAFEA